MALMRRRSWKNVFGELRECISYSRCYSSKMDLRSLRPVIIKRIEDREKEYPIPDIVPVVKGVVRARGRLIRGISTLLKVFPIVTCKFCQEVYVGEKGHMIRTCCGPWLKGKKFLHRWVSGGLSDILVQVETFHWKKPSHVIEDHQRFDFDRLPAVLELCWRLGVHPSDETLCPNTLNSDSVSGDVIDAKSLSPYELRRIAEETYKAWETLRTDVQRLLRVYPAKVCTYCSEVHVGPSGHNGRLCGVYKNENWRGTHLWKKAKVDDLLPEKVVWRRRSFDPAVLLNKGRGYYGHLPALVELCVQAGFVPPPKHFCMMKVHGLPGRIVSEP